MQGGGQWSWKTVDIPTRILSAEYITKKVSLTQYIEQPITDCQLIGGHASYPADIPIATSPTAAANV